MQYGGDVLRQGPFLSAIHAIDAVNDRLESPAERLLRRGGTRSSYLVLPLFALANAGVILSIDIFETHQELVQAIIAGLVIGKPLGMTLFAVFAVAIGIPTKPKSYSWRHVTGATALAGIGFTMSVFVAEQAFVSQDDFAAAKIGVFAASVLAALVGATLLWHDSSKNKNTKYWFEQMKLPNC